MLWTVVDLVLGLLALIALAVLCLRLWRQTKSLARETAGASAQLAQARAVLSGLPGDRPAPSSDPVTEHGGRRRPTRH